MRQHGGKAICMWPPAHWDNDELAALVKTSGLLVRENPFNERLNVDTLRFTRPLFTNGLRFATLVIELDVPDQQIPAVEQLLSWSAVWLEQIAKQNREKSQRSENLLTVLEKSSAYDDLEKNSYAFCSHLVNELPLKQAVFCTHFRGAVQVLSVSKTPNLDRRSQPFEQLTQYLAHRETDQKELARQRYADWLMRNDPDAEFHVYPLNYESELFGYLVVFYSRGAEVDHAVGHQIPVFLRYITPMYFKFFWAGLPWYKRWLENTSIYLKEGSDQKRRWIYAGLVVVLLATAYVPIDFKIKADAKIEGIVQRAIVVPEDGYLKEAHVKAGEQVKKNQVIALLDEKAIRLDVQRWRNEKEEYQREYNKELTALDHVQMRIAQAKMAQAQAKLEMFQERLQRTKISAPIDGVIIKGDLSRAVGTPVKQGQVLYEIAPANQFKLVLMVSELDIAELREGKTGHLKLAAFPSEKIPFVISAMSSVYEEGKRDLSYRVEASLSGSTTGLRPGMSGHAKIIINKRPLIAVFFRPVLGWFKLWWWKLV